MPANPGNKKAVEKKKKKRAAAQKARRAMHVESVEKVPEIEGLEEVPHPFAQTVDYDELDKQSAEARKLIKKKRYDEAEKLSQELAKKFPGQSDGLQRLAEVYEARGEMMRARDTLRLASKRSNEGDDDAAAEIAEALARVEKALDR